MTGPTKPAAPAMPADDRSRKDILIAERTGDGELRSTAEEPETSQEELQSVNEELQTVNQELQTVNQELKVRIDEITHAGDDRRNLISSTFLDVTERHAAEQARNESEARFRALVDASSDVIFRMNPDWTEMRQLSGEKFLPDLGAPNQWMAEYIVPEELETLQAAIRESVREGRMLELEHRVRRKDGSVGWTLTRAVPMKDAQGNIIEWFGAASDIHERRMAHEKLEERVRERTQALLDLSRSRQQLLERLVTSIEEERQRIARELHDEMGQHITALRVRLDAMQSDGNDLQDVKSIITRIDQSIDRLTLELRPPTLDQLGLHGAITSLADQFATDSGIRVDLHLGINVHDRFAAAIESTIYRVLQESLTNVSKHAGATSVSVILERERASLRLIVEDNGRGFDPAAADGANAERFGLLGMRERLAMVRGMLEVESAPGQGATVYVRVPLDAAENTGEQETRFPR